MTLTIFISLIVTLLVLCVCYYFYPRTYLTVGLFADLDTKLQQVLAKITPPYFFTKTLYQICTSRASISI